MVADALIYHPSVAHYLKFVATTGTSTFPAPWFIHFASAHAIPTSLVYISH